MYKFLLSLLFCAHAVMAAESMPWKNQKIKCASEFANFAKEHGFENEVYRQIVGDSYNDMAYRNLSTKIGQWNEVHLKENKWPVAYELKDEKLTSYSFNKDCSFKGEIVSLPYPLSKIFETKMPEDWRNEDLKNLLTANKKGVIYTWSPKFVYSVLVIPQVERLAHELGYEFTAVVDPRVSRSEILESLKKLPTPYYKKFRNLASSNGKFKRNLSTDLFMRGGFDHFPITYVYKNGKIHPRWITGVMMDNGFKELVKTYSAEL